MDTQKAGRVAFQHPAFVYFQAARLVAIIGLEMQSVAVGWQVYEITRQPLALGYVGLAQFLPGLLLFLITGHTADRYNRRNLLIICHAGFALSSTLLFFATRSATPDVSHIYAIMVLVGVVRAFSGPASRSILQMLVPDHHFGNAIAWNATFYQAAVLIGPSLGGLAYSFLGGPTSVYTSAVVAAIISAILLMKVQTRPALEHVADSIWAGLRYVRRQKVVLGSISLDLFAVLFGGAVALLPVYASEILHTGPWGLGLLRSSPAVGAATMAVILAFRPVKKRVGVTLFIFVALFGVFTILFGLSRNLWLSMAALFMVGACDMVSIIIRNMLVQMSTPDQMRGRVTAIELIFIGASNELGEFESGLTAHWFGAVPAVLAGGVGSLLVVALWAFAFPALRETDEFTRVSNQASPDWPPKGT
ncbi:MAG: MFS transporter [Acidobacteria bacterium]|nr:MFS transporter [Acidobacteriota bacterium]